MLQPPNMTEIFHEMKGNISPDVAFRDYFQPCRQDQDCFNLNALAITEAELRLIANAAIIGESNQPVNG